MEVKGALSAGLPEALRAADAGWPPPPLKAAPINCEGDLYEESYISPSQRDLIR